jgi:hypothetical protein
VLLASLLFNIDFRHVDTLLLSRFQIEVGAAPLAIYLFVNYSSPASGRTQERKIKTIVLK